MCSLLSRAVASPCALVRHVTYAKDGAFTKTFLTKKIIKLSCFFFRSPEVQGLFLCRL